MYFKKLCGDNYFKSDLNDLAWVPKLPVLSLFSPKLYLNSSSQFLKSQDALTFLKITEDPPKTCVYTGYVYQYLPYYKLKLTNLRKLTYYSLKNPKLKLLQAIINNIF